MTDAQIAAQLDAMQGAEDTRAWEALNAEDPKAQEALELLNKVVKLFEEAEKCLSRAADLVDNTPEGCRVLSLKEDTDELEIAVRMQAERMQ